MKLIFASLLAAAAWAAPCLTDTPQCTEPVIVGSKQHWSLVYRSFPLTRKNTNVTRAVIMIHGQGRNAHHYFRTAVAAAFLAGAVDDTVVVSPRIASKDRGCQDKLGEGEISWPCSGNSWRAGGAAPHESELTSYDLMDQILRLLASKETFPNLRTIVVAGHSAGGQFVSRYAMANKVHEKLGVNVRYAVSNPSSYAYFDRTRLSPAGTCVVKEGCTGHFTEYSEGRNCTTFNQWPYGLEKRQGYAAKLSDEELKKQLASRPVTYVLGELDNIPVAGFDGACPAMAQGPSRIQRGLAYVQYTKEKIKAEPEVVVVPLCGHNARCIFTADPALPVLFPKM